MDQLQLGLDDLSVYFAVHIDGARGQISVIQTKANSHGKMRDLWHVVRHFRIASVHPELFDNEWHFLGISVGWSGGRYEANLFVDGFSKMGSTTYSQCLPFPPQPVQKLSNTTFNQSGVTLQSEDGALIFGYHFQGALDEVRVYNYKVEQFVVVAIGGDVKSGSWSGWPGRRP